MEKRSQPRIQVHSPVKMTRLGKSEHYYGFVADLSIDGIKIVSPDYISNASQMACGFFLENHNKKISPMVLLVHTRKGVESVFYYGFKFSYISDEDKNVIETYITLSQSH